LCVLDGIGERAATEGNAVAAAATPVLDALRAKHATTVLDACVGMGQRPGSGDLGHRMLGAGRVVPSARAVVDEAVAARKVASLPLLDQLVRVLLYDRTRLHLLTQVGESGITAAMDHLLAFADAVAFNDIPIVVHAILDGGHGGGRDALRHLEAMELHLEGKNAVIGTISGRAYGMDQEGRWDRTYESFHAIVRDKTLGPEARRSESVFEALSQAYKKGLDDTYVEPTRLGEYQGVRGDFTCDFGAEKPIWQWTGAECALAVPFRADGVRQLVAMLTDCDLPREVREDLLIDRDKPTVAFPENQFVTLTSYGAGLPACFASDATADGFAEVLSRAGKKQLRVAETLKSAHVTTHFSGREEPFDGEERRIVPSPLLVDRPAEKPAMSSGAVAAVVEKALAAGEHDFILVNLGNADALAHTGDFDATVQAVAALDEALGRIVKSVEAAGGTLLVTADHGACEEMVDQKGQPRRGHSSNPVPLIHVGQSGVALEPGTLADVAPTMLALMGLEQPAAMTGRSLLGR
jgi:2,3-bisphosphoglycerate-independent phosphoglycerate mutase